MRAADVVPSAAWGKHWHVIAAALPALAAAYPTGMTNREIAAATVPPYRWETVQHAMVDAERAGVVQRCGARPAGRRGGYPPIEWRLEREPI